MKFMVLFKYLLDSNTIIHASKEMGGQMIAWIDANKPFVTDVSKYECLVKWRDKHEP
jgi:hypothetical protein